MDKTISITIYEKLKDQRHYEKLELYAAVAKSLGLKSISEVDRVFGLMKDKSEVSYHEDSSNFVRLTHKGVLKYGSTKKEKTMNYLANNWIALVAIILSIISLIKK